MKRKQQALLNHRQQQQQQPRRMRIEWKWEGNKNIKKAAQIAENKN